MQRHFFGLFALSFLTAAAVLALRDYKNSEFLLSVCLRVGLVLAAIWLAYRQVQQLAQRLPSWLLAGLFGMVLLIAVRPRLAWLIFPALLVLGVLQCVGWILKPLPKRKPRKRADGS